jgi:two-component system phosphate regulon response regulator OmpR
MEYTGHVLIVDDDLKIRTLLKKYLSNNGWLVSSADSTAECDRCLNLFKFNVIIMDVMMPKETGFEYLQRKKKFDCPIIMLSALGHVDDKISGLLHGADDYLTKPFEPKELLIRISKLAQRKKSANRIRFGNFVYDMVSQNLYESEKLISITNSQKMILQKLAQNLGSKVNKDEP